MLAIWRRPINIFLLGGIVALWLAHAGAAPWLVLILAALAAAPFSNFILTATEELTEALGSFVGSLISMMSSVLEPLVMGLVVLETAPAALRQALICALIAGMLVRNLLLLPGLSTFLGALRHGRLRFDAGAAANGAVGLLIPLVIFLFPAILAHAENTDLTALDTIFPFSATAIVVVAALAIVVLGATLDWGALGRSRRRRARQRISPRSAEYQPDVSPLFAEERAAAMERLERAERLQSGEARRVGGHAHTSHSAGQWHTLDLWLTPDRRHILPWQPELLQRADLAHALLGSANAAPAAILTASSEVSLSRQTDGAAIARERRRAREERGERSLLLERPVLRALVAVLVLAIASAGLVSMAELIVSSLTSLLTTHASTPSMAFLVGFLVFPLVVEQSEIYAAIALATRRNMELALAIRNGASWKIVGVVGPLLYLVSLLTGTPFALDFPVFAILASLLALLVSFLVTLDGEVTAPEGAMMVALWLSLMLVAFAGISSA